MVTLLQRITISRLISFCSWGLVLGLLCDSICVHKLYRHCSQVNDVYVQEMNECVSLCTSWPQEDKKVWGYCFSWANGPLHLTYSTIVLQTSAHTHAHTLQCLWSSKCISGFIHGRNEWRPSSGHTSVLYFLPFSFVSLKAYLKIQVTIFLTVTNNVIFLPDCLIVCRL